MAGNQSEVFVCRDLFLITFALLMPAVVAHRHDGLLEADAASGQAV